MTGPASPPTGAAGPGDRPVVVRDPADVQRRMLALHREGRTIAVVPTMGALHEGHRTLIAEGRRRADVLIVTIFVNPTQVRAGRGP